jgi:hypothetical protein
MARASTREKVSNRKISETFPDFAAPRYAPLGAKATELEMENALKIAFTVWNFVVIDAVNRNSRWVTQARELASDDPHIRELVEQLVVRKQRLFGNDHRVVGEYRLYRQQRELRLRAKASRDAPPLANPNRLDLAACGPTIWRELSVAASRQ